MSTIKTKKVQVGTDSTASNNFTIYTPGTPDGTVRIGNGNADSVTDAITLDSSGNITAAQNLTVSGTTTATGAITSTGGIYLGGTAAANLLDDYEEGTFTPTLTPSSGSITTYSNQLGYYTKVGNRVFCTIRISVTNIGTASGDMYFGGLPFANGQSYRVACFGREDGFLGVMLQLWIDGSSTTGVIRKYDDTNVGYNNSMNLLLTLNYFTS